ncbi:hypothetical protein [Streptomyces sp. 058-1L]
MMDRIYGAILCVDQDPDRAAREAMERAAQAARDAEAARALREKLTGAQG